MREPISFFVPGQPKGQPRPRAFARKMGSKYVARVYDAGTAEGWKSQIAMAAREHTPETPFAGPVEVGLTFLIPRPKSHFRTGKHADKLRPDAPSFCIKKPDADNLAKAILDALTQLGGWWKDDDQVARLSVQKIYLGQGYKPGCFISIQSLNHQALTCKPTPI